MNKSEGDKEVIFTFPPDPLHLNIKNGTNLALGEGDGVILR